MSRFGVVPLVLLTFALGAAGCSCESGGPNRGDQGNAGDGGGGDGGGGDGGGGDATVDMNRPDSPPPVPPDVHVLLTADNAYGFGYGSSAALVDYFEGVEDGSDRIFLCSAACDDETPCADNVECDIFGTCNDDRFGPETYVVPGDTAPANGYLYVVVWSDELVTQGLIGQFRTSDGSGTAVYTGSPDWEVCATGVDIDPQDADPTVSDINTQIANCNMGAAGTTFSSGWIGTELGNNPSGVMELSVLTNVAD